jgi:LacI family transcriptional regulator
MHDVARLAGVGTASVDRVLNDRGNVSEDVSKKVLQAARELGIRRILPHSHRRQIRVDVILARPELPLIARIGYEFRRLATSLDRSIVIHHTVLDNEQPETLARALLKTSCDAVVSYIQDHPVVHAAIEKLHDKGVPVVTVISDIPGSMRIGYAGTDHYRAGRSAGFFITQMARRPGAIVILCNHLGFQSHADRVRGLSDFLKEKAPEWQLGPIVEGGDDRYRSEVLLRDVFKREKETSAIYNVGAANIGVAGAIRADILSARPVFVGHELTRYTAAFLREGVMSLAIDQNPELQVRRAINFILHFFNFAAGERNVAPSDFEVPIVLYGPENIPDPLPF